MDTSLFDMNNSIVKVQRDIMLLKEKLKKEEKDQFIELNEMINPNDIVVDEDNIKEQVQTIIDYTVTPKTKVNNKKLQDMIDKGEIEIK
jgi:predicted nucleotidyltransferase